MDYNCFLKEILRCINEIMPKNSMAEIQTTQKNNGVLLDSLIIRKPDDMVCPNIYLGPFYDEYRNGASVGKVVSDILDAYMAAEPARQIEADELINHDVICRNVVYRLINYDCNSGLLDGIPHEQFLDLALIYYVLVHIDGIGEGAVMVRNDFLDYYSLTGAQLRESAYRNTHRLLPSDFLKITDLLREYGEKSGAKSYSDIALEEDSEAAPLYVLTNKSRQFGAYYMTDMELLSGIAARLNTDLYILPSSVHECMVVPADMWDEPETLSSMVREINHSHVSKDEFLSDTVYRFINEEKRMKIAV